MKLRQWNKRFKALTGALLLTAVLGFSVHAQKQEHSNANVRSGQKALLEGNFKAAASHFQKALPEESSDPDVVYLLGYSQFQSGDFDKAAKTFGDVLKLDPKNVNAYYYRGKSTNNKAVIPGNKLNPTKKEELLNAAIADYSKAIEIDKDDVKLYQNRAIAYRDLGILIGTDGTSSYNKGKATEAYNGAIADFKKVLTVDAARKDIQTELKKATVYRDNLK